MRLVGVLLVGFGATLAWYLGVKGEDLATLRRQIFAFFGVADPGSVLPAAGTIPSSGVVGVPPLTTHPANSSTGNLS